MIGLFGGTFDPVHVGHESIARSVFQLGMDRVVVMPCFLSPHKVSANANGGAASEEDRFKMLELALGKIPGVEISRYELDKGGISFTWQTLDFLRALYPEAKLALIVGMDQFLALPKWSRFKEWNRGLDIFVFGRSGIQEPIIVNKEYEGALYHWPNIKIPDVSATEIRNQIKTGKSLANLVNPEVEKYIKMQKLYL